MVLKEFSYLKFSGKVLTVKYVGNYVSVCILVKKSYFLKYNIENFTKKSR